MTRRRFGRSTLVLCGLMLSASPGLSQAETSVYVANASSGNVSQYDVLAGGGLAPKPTSSVDAGAYPAGVAVSPDGKNVYVTNDSSGDISQYTVGAGGELVPKEPDRVVSGGGPVGVAVRPDGRSVYVVNPFSSNGPVENLWQYDVDATGGLAPKTPSTVTSDQATFAVVVSPDGRSVYATNESSNDVSQYDADASGRLTPKASPTVATGRFPVGLAVSPNGRSVFVSNYFDNTISQYDVDASGALTPKANPTVQAGTGPDGMAMSPDGKSLYLANGGDGRDNTTSSVWQYAVGADGALTHDPSATVGAGATPFAVAVNPDGKSVYVTNQFSDDISQYDVVAGGRLAPKPSATVAAGQRPFAIATAVSPAAARHCVVPKLKGKTLAASKRALRTAHCKLGKVTRRHSRSVRKGRVIAQRPKPGTRKEVGGAVAITLSRGR